MVLMWVAYLSQAHAQNFEAVAPTGQTLYYHLDNGAAVVDGHAAINGALEIPDSVTYEGVSYPVTRIGEGVFSSATGMTAVTIPATVTQMDYIAFNECTALTRVDYGGTLAQWVSISFEWYGNPLIYAHHLYIDSQEVTSVVIPEGVSEIKRYAFHGFTGMETVTLPSTLDTVGEGAFNDCSSLARTYCTSLADWCGIGFANEQSNPLYWSRKLYVGNSRVVNTLVVPEGVTAVKPYAFFRLNNVYSVELPEGLLTVGRYAFWEWEWNVTYHIPSTVTTLGEYSFYGAGPVYYDAVNCTVVRNDTWAGAVALPHVDRLIVGEGVQRMPRFLLPYDDYMSVLKLNGTTPPEVANYAFDNLRSRVVIQVPCGLSSTYSAAEGWDELENSIVETPPFNLTIGVADHGWTNLEREPSCQLPARISAGANEHWHFVRWSDGVADNPREITLTQDTFLTPIYAHDVYDTLDNGLVIYYYANSTGVTLGEIYGTITGALVIPDSVLYDGMMQAVTEIRCGGLNEQRNMTSVTLPKGLTKVSGFYECTGLTRVDFGGTIAQWCNIVFENWHSNPTRYAHHLYIGGEEVVNLVIPEGVNSIGYSAFIGLNAMTTVTIPVSLDSVGEAAFEGCDGLVRVNYNGTLADWCNIGFHNNISNPLIYGHNLYIGGSKVTELVIPVGVSQIKNEAFNGINDIQSVVLPEGLLSIGRNAFVNTLVDDGITIPTTVTYIGTGAIRGPRIFFNATNCTTFENDAFYEGEFITVGENVQALPTNLFTNRITTLKMKGNPPTVAQHALERLRSDCQVVVPCGMQATYSAAAEWSAVSNLTERPMFEIAFGDAENGRAYVQNEATCTTPAQVHAENYSYHHFVRWTDGNTSNPRYINLTQDTLLTPVFAIDTYAVALEVYDTMQGWVAFDNSQSLAFHVTRQVEAMDSLTLVARAKPGHRFLRWDDWDYENYNDSVRRVPVHSDRTYHPQFETLNLCDTTDGGHVFCYIYRDGGMMLNSVSNDVSGDVVIPDSVMCEGMNYPVTAVGSWVFGERHGVTTITLPATLRFVGGDAFYNMQGLTRVNYNGTLAQWCAIDFESGWSNPVLNARHLYIGGEEVLDLNIPEGVTSIGRNAFRGMNAVPTLTLPSTLDTVGFDAFEDCNGLVYINYTGTVADWCRIGFYEDWGSNPLVFTGQLYINGVKVTHLVIPEGVTAIKPYAFQGLSYDVPVQLPEGLLSIGRNAFGDAWRNVMTVPSTVVSMGEWAIRASTVYYNAVNCTQMSNNAIPDVPEIVVGEGVQTLPLYLISNSVNTLRMQDIPPTVNPVVLVTRLREDAQVYVRCGLLDLYQQDAVWGTLGSRLTESNTFSLKFAHSDYGWCNVSTEASCSTPAEVWAYGNTFYHFLRWSDGNTDNPRTITLTQDTMLTPEFAIDTYTVVPVVCNGWNERGSVTGGGTVAALQTVTITAHANPGYYFTGWSDGDGQAEHTVEVTDNREICANFEEMQYVSGQLYYRYIEGRGMMVSGHDGDIVGHLVIPDTVEFSGERYPVIGVAEWALSSQGNMTAITLPATVDTMAYYAVAYNDNLTAVHFGGTLAQWCSIIFANFESNPVFYAHHLYIGGEEVVNPVIPEGVTSIGKYAFARCSEFANLTLPSTLDTIGYDAFYECYAVGRTRFMGTIAQWCNIGFASEQSNPITHSRNLFLGSSKVTELSIPAGVTTIKPYAFFQCNSINSVTFGDDVRTIGEYAFQSCELLTTVNFNTGLTNLEMCAFRYCSNVRLFDLPDSLKSIETNAFWDCYNATVIIPANVNHIASNILWCGQLYYNAVNCQQLSNNAFPSLGTVTVGENVQVLPYGLITQNLNNLRMLCPPPTVENFALDRLRGDAVIDVACGLLSLYRANDEWNEVPERLRESNVYTITFTADEHGGAGYIDYATCTTPARVNAWANEGWHFMRWSDGNGDNPRDIMLTQDTVLTPVFAQDIYDTLPDGSMFYYYYNGAGLTLGRVIGTLSGSVVIPDSVMYENEMMPVTRIDGWVFSGQQNMTQISLPATMTEIGSGAFGNGIRTIFRGSVAQWCNIMFEDSGSQPARDNKLVVDDQEVMNLVVPEGVTSIGQWAFYNFNNILSVTLPSTLDTIANGAFEGCGSLQRTNFNGTLADWCDIGFAYGWNSNPIAYSRNLYIGGVSLTNLTLPEGILAIKPYAFYGLSTLRSIELPEGLLTIGRGAFWDCAWDLSVNIPSSVTHIEENALYGASTLYYNAINCTVDNNAAPHFNTVVVGEGVETLPMYLVTGNTWILRMQGNPPTVSEYILDRLPEGSQVQVKCNLLSLYQNAPVWSNANLVETNTYSIRFGSAEHGRADMWQWATCTTPAQVYATNDSYYHFVAWTDGVTDNPRNITLTQDTLLTPIFAIDTYTVAVEVYDTLQGSVSVNGQQSVSVQALDTLTIEAHAYPGFTFLRWDDWDFENYNDSVRTVVANYNRTFRPQFEPFQFCDTSSGIVSCYRYNGHGMTLQSVNGTISGIFAIPDSVTYEGLKFPVTEIDGWVFNGQSSMTWITLPKHLRHVGCDAFSACDNLSRVIWNGDIEQWCQIDFDCWNSNPIYFARHMFMEGREVVNLVVPEGVHAIKRYAFVHLSSLASVTLPSTLDTLGNAAFEDCNGLQRTYFGGTVADWCRIGINDGWSSTPINYSRNLYIGGELVTNLVIPESVTAIKPFAFAHLSSLHSIELPEGLLSIGQYAFYDCNWNLSVTIPSTVIRVEQEAIMSNQTLFYNAVNCEYMANNALPYFSTVYVSDSVQSIPTYLITGNINQLKMQGLPPSVTGDVLDRLRDDAQVVVPCGLLTTYQNTPFWDSVNLVESNTYALKFESLDHGSAGITVAPTCTTPAEVTAWADWKWHFTQWADGVTDNPRTVTLTQDTVLVPMFAIDTYFVVGNVWPSSEYGVVIGNDTVLADDTVTLVARANYGYHFIQWADGEVDSVRTIVAENNWWVDAMFEPNLYNATAKVDPTTPYGTIRFYDGTIDTTGDSITVARVYSSGTAFMAVPQTGYHFTQWDDGVTDNPRYFTVAQDTQFVAQFEINTYSVIGTAMRGMGYVFDFENPADDAGWTLVNGTYTNRWYIGTCDTGNNRALFVSDNGYDNHYDNVSEADVWAYRPVSLMPGNYSYSFDWVCPGESGWDFARIALMPAASGLVQQDWGQYSVPADAIMLDGGQPLVGTTEWQTVTGSVVLAQGGSYNLIVYWRDDNCCGNSYAAVLDNIMISPVDVADTSGVVMGTVLGSDTVTYLDSVTLTAIPEYGFHFSHWNDGDTANPRTVVAVRNITYVAVFDHNSYSVALAPDNTEHGSVAGAGSYDYLTDVELSAVPAYGYHFVRWNDSDTNNPRHVVLTQDTSFTAQFTRNSYTVAAQANSVERGVAVVSDSMVLYLDTVTVSATPNYGYYFMQWSDGVTDNPRQSVVTADVVYTAQFGFNQYSVSLAVDSTDRGSVSGAGDYNYLSSVTIEATANYGYHFTQWSDGVTDNPRTISLTQDTAFTAFFANNSYSVTLASNDDSLGTVTGSGTYEYLDQVSLTASVVAPHHHFVRWSDGVTDSVRTVTVTADLVLTAFFAIDTHTVVTVARLGDADGVGDYPSCGTVIGTGSYPYGTVVEFEATAAEGYHFAEWDNGDRTLTRLIEVTQDTLVAAVFTDDVVPSLCMVSVQNGHNTLTWSKDMVVDRYNIYREASTAGVYAVVATVPFDSLSAWVDTNSRPTTRSYRYKMTAVDIYGYESDFGTVHKTMHLTISQGIGTNWNLVWTEYEGADYSTYVIYRGTDASNIEEIDIMPSGGNTTYTDENAPEGNVYYQVGIMLANPCSPTKSSNIVLSNIATNGTVGIQSVESGDFTVTARQGRIVVEGANGMPVTIYDVAGRRIAEQAGGNVETAEFSVISGVYLVKVGAFPARRVVVTR